MILACILCAVGGGIVGLVVASLLSASGSREHEQEAYKQGRLDERRDVIAKINTFYGIKNGETVSESAEQQSTENE